MSTGRLPRMIKLPGFRACPDAGGAFWERIFKNPAGGFLTATIGNNEGDAFTLHVFESNEHGECVGEDVLVEYFKYADIAAESFHKWAHFRTIGGRS